jgi:hypothetical protein
MAEVVQIISKLSVDASGVYSEIDKVNAKYGQSTEALRNQQKELDKLLREEAGLQAQRAKTNNPTIIAQFNNELKKTQQQIDATKKSMKGLETETEKTGAKAKEAGAGIGNAFDGTTKRAQTLKQELKSLQNELETTDDPERFQELVEQTGALKDRIKDAAEATNAFANESKATTAKNLFGSIVGDIANLDFKGAADKAKQFGRVMSSITLKETTDGIKGLATTLGNVGKALIANPFFLLVAAIAAVGLALKGFYDSMDAGNKTLAENEENLKGVTEATRDLERANRDLQLQNEVAAGKVSETDGKLLEAYNKFNDKFVDVQKERLKVVKDFNEKIEAEREEDGFALTKSIFEALGGETDLTRKQKEGLLDIEKTYNEQEEALRATYRLEKDAALIEAQKAEKKKKDEANKKALDDARAQQKKLRELEISNIGDDVARARAVATEKYNNEFVLAKGNKALIAELARQLDKELKKIDDDEIKRKDEIRKKAEADYLAQYEKDLALIVAAEDARKAALLSSEDEEERHQAALLDIKTKGNKDAEIILLTNEIRAAKERLALLKTFGEDYADEVVAQANKVEELEAKKNERLKDLDNERKIQIVESTKQLVDEVLKATKQILASEQKRVESQISLQEKRLEKIRAIAENGNAQLLQLEQDRLDALTKQREKYVRAQQTLASIELIANTAVTISKAASQGGAAAAVTIAAALIALVAGLASARSIASQAAFFKGGESDGYTGNGNIHSESNALGKKPYIYHKKEFIFNNEKTSKYIDIFRGVHKGEIDLNKMKAQSDLFQALRLNNIDTSRDVYLRSLPSQTNEILSLKSSLQSVVEAINSQERTKVIIDDNGIAAIATRFERNKKRINSIS